MIQIERSSHGSCLILYNPWIRAWHRYAGTVSAGSQISLPPRALSPKISRKKRTRTLSPDGVLWGVGRAGPHFIGGPRGCSEPLASVVRSDSFGLQGRLRVDAAYTVDLLALRVPFFVFNYLNPRFHPPYDWQNRDTDAGPKPVFYLKITYVRG